MSTRTPPFSLPPGCSRVKAVHSFEELVTTPFADGINALCWQRNLPGNFVEVVEHLTVGEGISTIDEDLLISLPLSDEGRTAVQVLLADQQLLRAHGLDPILDCVQGCLRDDDSATVATDVYSFHADSATVETDTYLCSYAESASEGLSNEQAVRRIDIPETRARLLEEFGGEDDDAFQEYLADNCYDLHYAPLPNAQPFSFGIGNLWRIAVQYPGSPVPPCIHRAPETIPGRPARLLLIS